MLTDERIESNKNLTNERIENKKIIQQIFNNILVFIVTLAMICLVYLFYQRTQYVLPPNSTLVEAKINEVYQDSGRDLIWALIGFACILIIGFIIILCCCCCKNKIP
jgi:ABC-type nitrate/sulfonate/bicarbonate transport system permease component